MTTRLLLILLLAAASLSAQAQPSDLLQGVKTSLENYSIGQSVEFTFAIKNDTDKPITYTFPSASQFDLWITLAGQEIYTLSKHQVSAQVITTLTLEPDEVKNYTYTWDQKDNSGKDVGPGTYTVCAQLTPNENEPPAVGAKFTIGKKTAALVPLTVSEIVKRVNELEGRRVRIDGTFKGFQPDPNDPNIKNGPPITRSDWAVCDSTGCMYVTGPVALDTEKDVGSKISVIGKVKMTDKGQIYLVFESATY